MKTRRHARPGGTRLTLLITVALLFVAACAASASPVPSTPPDGTLPTAPIDGGGSSGGSGSEPGAGGGAPGDPGSGSVDPGGGGAAIPDPQGTLVFPQPGVLDPQPVPVQAMRREPADGHVVVRLDWTSGVEPCYVLSSVAVARDGDTFTLTVFEGSLGRMVACIEMAQFKATLVDLGELPAGSYTVVADPGFAAPLTIAVP